MPNLFKTTGKKTVSDLAEEAKRRNKQEEELEKRKLAYNNEVETFFDFQSAGLKG